MFSGYPFHPAHCNRGAYQEAVTDCTIGSDKSHLGPKAYLTDQQWCGMLGEPLGSDERGEFRSLY